MQHKRLEYLDFIKGFAMMLVIFCHQTVIPYESIFGSVCILITYSAVPCLLMCSGYVLLFRREPARRSFERAWHVYGVMVIWKAIYLLCYRPLLTEWPDMLSVIRYLFLFGTLHGVETEHLWFLQAYLPILLLTPLLAPMFCERRHGMIAAFVALTYLSNQFLMSADLVIQVLSARFGFEPIALDQLSNVFPFGGEYSSMLTCFLLGGVFRLMDEKEITRKAWFLPASLLCFAGGLTVMMGVRFLQMGSLRWHNTLMVAKYEWSGTLVMSVGIFGLLRRIGEGRSAEWLARNAGCNSMGIYYLHYPLLMLLVLFVYPLLPTALWVNFAKTFVIAAVCIMLTKCGKRVPVVRKLLQ